MAAVVRKAGIALAALVFAGSFGAEGSFAAPPPAESPESMSSEEHAHNVIPQDGRSFRVKVTASS